MSEYIMKSSPILESDGTPLEIVGELIRCKDCKSRSEVSYKDLLGVNLYRCYLHECFVRDGDFCSFGEKK